MKILVAVPVFNEEKYVTRVLAEIRKYAPPVLVVDDGSTDSTPSSLRELAAQQKIALLTHPENRGYGQSLIDAFKYASAHGFDWVITMDCDEQHEPSKIPMFIDACLRDDADIISGSRYLVTENNADQPPADRRNINRIITAHLNATLHLRVLHSPTPSSSLVPHPPAGGLTDSFCGYKAHRVSAMNALHLTIPGYAFPMQFWVQAAAHHLRISELPVRLIYKDATRHFGGNLDDPTSRLQHYMEVLHQELQAVRLPHPTPSLTPCCQT